MSRPSLPAGSPPAVELAGLGRDLGERPVLVGVSLTLPFGATLAVLGPNGAGKTTLLKVLAGLLAPSRGKARVLGADLPRDRHLLRGRIGFLGHDLLLYRDLTVRENLDLHRRLHGLARERLEEVLEAVGATHFAERPLRELSRGMAQRVAAARAVLGSPPLLLLDEPHANLDPAARRLLGPLIGRECPSTRVLTSHDPAAALAEADYVLGLRDGRAAVLARATDLSPAELQGLYR